MQNIEYIAEVTGSDPSELAAIVRNCAERYQEEYAEDISWEAFIEEVVCYEYRLPRQVLDYMIDNEEGELI